MHFDPEGPSDDDRKYLWSFTRFLAELRSIQAVSFAPLGDS
jgi:hypothetical protein